MTLQGCTAIVAIRRKREREVFQAAILASDQIQKELLFVRHFIYLMARGAPPLRARLLMTVPSPSALLIAVKYGAGGFVGAG